MGWGRGLLICHDALSVKSVWGRLLGGSGLSYVACQRGAKAQLGRAKKEATERSRCSLGPTGMLNYPRIREWLRARCKYSQGLDNLKKSSDFLIIDTEINILSQVIYYQIFEKQHFSQNVNLIAMLCSNLGLLTSSLATRLWVLRAEMYFGIPWATAGVWGVLSC